MRRPFGFLIHILQTLFLTVVVYAAIRAFVAQPLGAGDGPSEAP